MSAREAGVRATRKTMIIDRNNYEIGNKAMASVLLLYYHLIEENGFTNDQTFYVNQDDFNGFDFLNVQIEEKSNESLDLNEDLIKQGAVIYLLSDLNDIIGEYDDCYLSEPRAKKIITALETNKTSPIIEVEALLEHMSVPEDEMDFQEYNKLLKTIYIKYVRGFFTKILA
jgi:hypothetical protein